MDRPAEPIHRPIDPIYEPTDPIHGLLSQPAARICPSHSSGIWQPATRSRGGEGGEAAHRLDSVACYCNHRIWMWKARRSGRRPTAASGSHHLSGVRSAKGVTSKEGGVHGGEGRSALAAPMVTWRRCGTNLMEAGPTSWRRDITPWLL